MCARFGRHVISFCSTHSIVSLHYVKLKRVPEFTSHLDLPIVCLEIVAEAVEPLHLPAFPGSKFEGALGSALFSLSCTRKEYHAKHGCVGCSLRNVCAYGVTYAPKLPPNLPRGLHHPPRPFALVTKVSEARAVKRGEGFTFGLNLMGRAVEFLPFVLSALHTLGDGGLGLTRGRFKTLRVQSTDPFGGDAVTLTSHAASVLNSNAITLSRETFPPLPRESGLRLTFQSMVQLRSRGKELSTIAFEPLVRALQRRLGNLEQIYGEAATVGLNYNELPALAQEIAVTDAHWRRVSQPRARNTYLSGVIGAMTLHGDLAPFATLLRYGELVGVGKWASFGLGRFRITTT